MFKRMMSRLAAERRCECGCSVHYPEGATFVVVSQRLDGRAAYTPFPATEEGEREGRELVASLMGQRDDYALIASSVFHAHSPDELHAQVLAQLNRELAAS